jgi:hypothetical protein
METQMIQGSPCPLCGENAFALESRAAQNDDAEYACLWESATPWSDAHLKPCECTGCGTVQMVVTRC